MKIIIVDANILFSGILNANSRIGNLRKGLASKGYMKCISTKELAEWRATLRLEQKQLRG